MAHPFEIVVEQALDATPEQTWEALTSGPAMDAWFMGTNEVVPGVGGSVRTVGPGFTLESTITTWEPAQRFVHTTAQGDDGRLMTFAYEIEGRSGGGTLLRFVHSGFLPGDDWEDEVDALGVGDPAYMRKLATYLRHFRGRRAGSIFLFGPSVSADHFWSVTRAAFGVDHATARPEDPVRARPAGLDPIDGVVDFVNRDFLAIRTPDAAIHLIHGISGHSVVEVHRFDDPDPAATERAWSSWLERAFA